MTSLETLENADQVKNSIDSNSIASSIRKSLSRKQKAKMLLAEVIGTGMLVFFGCMGCIDWIQDPSLASVASLSIPLTFGLTVMFVIQIFGHISYAILNPAVAVAALVNNLIDYKMCFLYIIAEVIGGTLGMALLYSLTPADYYQEGLCVTLPHSSLSVIRTFFVEFFLTSALILVVCGVWHPQNRNLGDSAPLRIGLAVAAISIAGGPLTDASMNPARSFGPAVINWMWNYHWIYWISPMSAGLISSMFYRYVYI